MRVTPAARSISGLTIIMIGLVFHGSWWKRPSALRNLSRSAAGTRAVIRLSKPGIVSSGTTPPARTRSWITPGQMLEHRSGVVPATMEARMTSSDDCPAGIGWAVTWISGCRRFHRATSVSASVRSCPFWLVQ